jgi:hypothetical protein
VSTYISESLRNQIISTDLSRCCYCLTTEANSGIPMTYDHIKPVSKNGETSFENLCLACRTCNEFKGDATEAIDPLSGETVPIYNPRTQKWTEHFTWSFDACWEENGVNMNELKLLAPTLYNFSLQRAEQKIRYKGEIFPANYPANESATPYIDFFQYDTRTNIRKGIIAIDLIRWAPS